MRNFKDVKRIVIKVGTNVVTRDGRVDTDFIGHTARQVAELIADDRAVLIVSSGAIGMGACELSIETRITDTKMRQACAAIGQPLLMHEYHKAFKSVNVKTAQLLMTADVLDNRKTYLNLRNSVEKLLSLSVVPIVNENDTVSTDEIGSAFGDNDRLSALVASKIDADLLIMLSDIDAFYEADPRRDPQAKPIDVVHEITDELLEKAGANGSVHSTGGMRTKLQAAKIASSAGCRMVLANGRKENVIKAIMAGENTGTLFMPRCKLSNRKRWILNSAAAGTIWIDSGAVEALRNNKSLLPKGIETLQGQFKAGAVVMINDIAKAVCDFDSEDLKKLIGRHSSEIKKILGSDNKETVSTAENIVFLDY